MGTGGLEQEPMLMGRGSQALISGHTPGTPAWLASTSSPLTLPGWHLS